MLLLTMGVGLQLVGEDSRWKETFRAASCQAGVAHSEGLTGPHWAIQLMGRIYYDPSDITPRWG